MGKTPILYWVRRDLRLADNPALSAAAARGPVIPVFIVDEVVESHGAAPKWRLGLGVEAFGAALKAAGSAAFGASGRALDVLRALIAETGAQEVHWNRLYDPASRARDEAVKSALKSDGVAARSHGAMSFSSPGRWRPGQAGSTASTRRSGRRCADAIRASRCRCRSCRAGGLARERRACRTWASARDEPGRRGRPPASRHRRGGRARAAWAPSSPTASPTMQGRARRPRPRRHLGPVGEPDLWRDLARARCWWAGMRAMEEGKRGAETFPEGSGLARLRLSPRLPHAAHRGAELARGMGRRSRGTTDERAGEVRDWKRGRTGMPVSMRRCARCT
jgi:deoxyribodipyrimidine photo-lyase